MILKKTENDQIIFGEFANPQEGWIEATSNEKTEYKKSIQKNALVRSRLSYLQATDWYIAREADIPDSYPIEIKNKRVQARDEINQIQSATTLTQLEQFSETFE